MAWVSGLLLAALCSWAPGAWSQEPALEPVRIAPGVYVVYADPKPASYENEGLTANLGFVVTSAGIAVIDSGPSYRVAQTLHRAIGRISNYPIKYVINTGADPARWLGNSYFRKQGVPILAHAQARQLMQSQGPEQLKAMQALLQEKAVGTEIALPRALSGDSEEIRFSDSVLQLLYFGAGQRAGDIAVWLPRQEIAYAGALMQSEGQPELYPDSQPASWLAALDGIAGLRPRQVVPGRGKVGDLALMNGPTRVQLERVLHGRVAPEKEKRR